MAKVNLTDLAAGPTVVSVINNNNALLEAFSDNTLSLDGTTPNVLLADIDMNGQKIINAGAPSADTDYVRQIDLETFTFPDIPIPDRTGQEGRVLTTNDGSTLAWTAVLGDAGADAWSLACTTFGLTASGIVTLTATAGIRSRVDGNEFRIEDQTVAGNAGPDLVLDRDVTGLGGGLQIGRLRFNGQNSAAADFNYATLEAQVESSTAGSEEGRFLFSAADGAAGTVSLLNMNVNGFSFNVGAGGSYTFFGGGVDVDTGGITVSGSADFSGGSGMVVGSPTGSFQGDGTINAEGLFIDGVAAAGPSGAANDFTAGGWVYLRDLDPALPQSFNAITTITQNTWETIGKTSSGMDYEWDELDDIPSTATAVILRVRVAIFPISTAYTSLEGYFRPEGSLIADTNATRAFIEGFEAAITSPAYTAAYANIYVPVTNDVRFEFNWDEQNVNTGSSIINMYVVGYVG